jgi:hypothetical protein
MVTEKEIYNIIKQLGTEECELLLLNFINKDDFELFLDDSISIIYMSFVGWYNRKSVETDMCDVAIVRGFIEYHSHRGAKHFSKKDVEITDSFKEEWNKRFGFYPEE